MHDIFVKIAPMRNILYQAFLIAGCLFLAAFSGQEFTAIEMAVMEKDFAKAEQLAQELLGSPGPNEQKNQALYYLGLSRLYLGKFLPAREAFEQLLELKPEKNLQERASIGIVDSYYMAGEYETALQRAVKLLKGSDSQFRSLIYLKIARAHLRLANWEAAGEYLHKITREYPGSFEDHLAHQLLEEKQYFAVQVGAFLDEKRAKNLVGDLQTKGQYAYTVETADKEGRRFYRVRVGQFSRLSDALRLEQTLSDLGYPTRIYP